MFDDWNAAASRGSRARPEGPGHWPAVRARLLELSGPRARRSDRSCPNRGFPSGCECIACSATGGGFRPVHVMILIGKDAAALIPPLLNVDRIVHMPPPGDGPASLACVVCAPICRPGVSIASHIGMPQVEAFGFAHRPHRAAGGRMSRDRGIRAGPAGGTQGRDFRLRAGGQPCCCLTRDKRTCPQRPGDIEQAA